MKKRIMVVDDNKVMVEMLKEYFLESKTVEVVDEAYDGQEAWNKIKENSYDCVLLDLIMPKKDGLFVLEQIKENKIKANVIVVTSYNEQETIRNVSEFGVRYFVLKPFDLKDLEKRIMEATRDRRENSVIDFGNNDAHIKVSKILHELGIPSHIKGYQYIRDAITMVYKDQNLIGGITKELYPEIGKKYNASVTRVERAIRHAIEVSWNRGDWDLMEEIFGHSVDIDRAKPTNSEFIVTIADKMRLDKLSIS
ncbi:MAG: sporulation transcription factor Spo0A [Tenericutes bacterium]|nr:sporulation transcription factor Spo0A [Mycoplasmatota bacterium]